MKKIKVVHHAKTVGYSGTDRTAQIFAKYLAQSERFQPYLLYREGDAANTRLDIAREWLGEDYVIGYGWEPGEQGRQSPYIPEKSNLEKQLSKIDPDIVHVHRSGYAEWPGFRHMAPRAKWVETNIFGEADQSPEPQIDANLYVSEYVQNRALGNGNPEGFVLFNPVEEPILPMTPENREFCRQQLLSRFKLPENAILLGRVGRADNFDPISLNAFVEVEQRCPEAFYLVVDPCQSWIDTAERLGIKNIRFIDPVSDDMELSNFYRGLDIYAHARHDGETFGVSLAEAMMHRVPVVSHESAIHNGQSEIIGNAGFVVPFADHIAYRDVLLGLIDNPELATEDEKSRVRLRDHFGLEGRRRAMRHFESSCVVSRLARIYDWVLAQ